MAPDSVDLDLARRLLALPREVGMHPETEEPILAGIGRYGPWLRHEDTYAAIPAGEDVLAIGLNRAVDLIAEKQVRREPRPGAEAGAAQPRAASRRTGRRCGSRPAITARSSPTGGATRRCRRRYRRGR